MAATIEPLVWTALGWAVLYGVVAGRSSKSTYLNRRESWRYLATAAGTQKPQQVNSDRRCTRRMSAVSTVQQSLRRMLVRIINSH
jgi:hypothetical protein